MVRIEDLLQRWRADNRRSFLELRARWLLREVGDQLHETVSWGGGTTTKRDLAVRMAFHNGVHTGQIIDLRRALGMPRLIR